MTIHTADGATYDNEGRFLPVTHDSLSNRVSPDPNNRPTLYIVGNEDTDGSIRLIFNSSDADISNIESREEGVWNDTGLRFATSSVEIGRDLILSAVAGILETNNPSGTAGHVKSLIPHIEFDVAGTRQPQTPILDAESVFVIYSGAVSEITATSIGIDLGQVPSRVIAHSFHEVGTVGATVEVEVSVYIGTDNTGTLINRRNLPFGDLVADTQLDIDYDNDLGFEGGTNVFMEFVSDVAFSLKTDSGGNPLTTHEAHELAVLEIVTENMIYDEALDQVLDNSLNPVYENQF